MQTAGAIRSSICAEAACLTLCAEISEAAFDGEGYRQIMGVIARRLQDTGELWRHVYKSLLLLEYMLKHGPQKVGNLGGRRLAPIPQRIATRGSD